MPERIIDATQKYASCSRNIKQFDRVDKAIRATMQTFGFERTNRSECIFRPPSKKAELWEIRVGDPERNRGTSGGFRLICIRVIEEDTVFLDYVSRRDEMNAPKVKNDYNNHLRDLKAYLVRTYERFILD